MMKQITFYMTLFLVSLIGSLNACQFEPDYNALKGNLQCQYSVAHATIEGIENRLYVIQNSKNEDLLTYNADPSLIKKGIDDLKSLAGYPKGAGPDYEPKPIERSAHLHLLRAGLSFLKGENGLPKDPSYGVTILEFYVHHRYSKYKEIAKKRIFDEIKKNPESWDSKMFFDELHIIRMQLTQEIEKRSVAVPFGMFASGNIAGFEKYFKHRPSLNE